MELEFKFYEYDVDVKAEITKHWVENWSDISEHLEYEINKIECLIYKQGESVHPDNIDKDVLNNIYGQAKTLVINNLT